LIKLYPQSNKKPIVNWLIGPLVSLAGDQGCNVSELKIPGGSEELIKLIKLVEEDKISNLMAKTVLGDSLESGVLSSKIIQDRNLFQISDTSSLEAQAEEVIKENSKSVQDFRTGKTNALMFLVGQVMKKTKGKANPKVVQEILKRRLSDA